ncbi:MAG: EMC3/TMCO1 family protein [Thaumarchaeota archaeon]|nr:EMC3/TMCO1 family protein [Nitrososphaerota archaeon]
MPIGALLGLLPSLSNAALQIASPVTISLSQTLLVVLEAIGVNCLYAVGRRKFTNIEKMRRVNAEMKAFRSEMSAAQKAGDKQKLEKLKKKQQQMQKMQAEMSMDNLKPTLLFMLPLLGVYYLVSSFIKNATLVIAPIPFQMFNYGPPIEVPFFWWYMICSFTFSGVITRLFGLSLD